MSQEKTTFALFRWIDELPWNMLLVVALLLGLAPFKPEPHLVEKLRMLSEGALSKPIDIFDLMMHSTPLIIVAIKAIRQFKNREEAA
uniref:RND transporter n=1 Tax=Magnetococcus massalia (strain MO-1) TaxID=451514 RepID=A0A1S7LP69_MAGMO|nr:conserved protein of unknown function [Candidatus Magnetococcus massalia]